MVEISASLVKELREKTSVGMMDCKKALLQTEGDLQAAIDLLRRSGAMKEIKEGRVTNEGRIAVYTPPVGAARIAELNCETDFVARNEIFVNLAQDWANGTAVDEDLRRASSVLGENIVVSREQEIDLPSVYSYVHSNGKIGVLVAMSFGNLSTADAVELARAGSLDPAERAREIAMHIAAANPKYVTRDEVPTELVEKERAFLMTQPDLQSKPEHVRVKMVEGRMSKFYQQLCLVDQAFVKEPSTTVGKLLSGQNATVDRFVRFEVGLS